MTDSPKVTVLVKEETKNNNESPKVTVLVKEETNESPKVTVVNNSSDINNQETPSTTITATTTTGEEIKKEEIIEVGEIKEKPKVDEEALAKAAAKEAKRIKDQINATREILQTEITYVKQLKMCEEFFVLPLQQSLQKDSQPIFPEEDYNCIFLDLSIITNVNKELLKSLEDWFRSKKLLNDGIQVDPNIKESDRALGKIFLRMTPFLKSYKTYCSRYDSNFKLVQERKKNLKKFKQFCEKIEFQPQVNFASLDSFLILPVQRIPRYNLLLTELIKHTKSEELDYVELCKALKEIQNVAFIVNDHMKELDIKQKILDIALQISNLTFEIVQPSRRFITQGEISYVSNAKGLTKRFLIIFNDLICITKKSNIDEIELTQKGLPPYDFRSAISFTNSPRSWILDLPDNGILLNCFLFITVTKIFTFFCKTLEEKKDWITKINHQIEDTEKKYTWIKRKKTIKSNYYSTRWLYLQIFKFKSKNTSKRKNSNYFCTTNKKRRKRKEKKIN